MKILINISKVCEQAHYGESSTVWAEPSYVETVPCQNRNPTPFGMGRQHKEGKYRAPMASHKSLGTVLVQVVQK